MELRGITRRGFAAVWIGAGLVRLEAGDGSPVVYPGADEKTPSRAQYFSWINNAWEGSTEEQTLVNLDFFRWLHDEYGMQLDIYAFDSGNIDGRGVYGSMDSERFRAKFPRGFGPIAKAAGAYDCRLGIWLGPDGFGNTPGEERTRTEMFVGLCRDLHFALFKIDGACTGLRPSKQDAFAHMMAECRRYSPDLILLNHRLQLGKALPYATTFLWESRETYIDVWMWNTTTATHHRAGALGRGLVPGLQRLAEDHGVCLSSCLDYWEDDLILQAFNRCLILAPEIYGNPWLLRDDEFPKLARIYNLHRRYRKILVNGMVLPEARYGPFAVSRGDERTRLLTLRNLTWNPVSYRVALDASIGLEDRKQVEVRRLHPMEKILGSYRYGSEVEVEVPPFRSCLLMATAAEQDEIAVHGCDYEVVRDAPGKPIIVKLLGMPGATASIRVSAGTRKFRSATLDGRPANALAAGRRHEISFASAPLRNAWHRKLGDLESCAVPSDAEALYEATCFAADNNALEVRSLLRSGPTRIPEVERARKALLECSEFVEKGIWDRNLFDSKPNTCFRARMTGGLLRVDFGEAIAIDRVLIRTHPDSEPNQSAASTFKAEVSSDLRSWAPLVLRQQDDLLTVEAGAQPKLRYLRVDPAPSSVVSVTGFRQAEAIDSARWRASNLFPRYAAATAAWLAAFTLSEAPRGSYLAIPISGRHGKEGAIAAMRVDGRPAGCPDRAVSFASNVWEYQNVESDSNYTYYFPVTPEMAGKRLDAVILSARSADLKAEVWITAYPPPFESKELILHEA